jgi:putative colanic acid biosynthesis UDP-glucose lipid carrier transferase
LVNGYRGKTDTDEKLQGRIKYDIKYSEDWTFALDIKIIFQTFFSPKAKERDMK